MIKDLKLIGVDDCLIICDGVEIISFLIGKYGLCVSGLFIFFSSRNFVFF